MIKSGDIRDFHNKIVNLNPDEKEKLIQKLTTGITKSMKRPFIVDKRSQLTFGQRTADLMTKWAGSWFFIIGFLVFLVLWMLLNTYFWFNYLDDKPFDPYPFILLNLVLSSLAAIQAPVILMSQNRAAQRDRLRAEYDYQVNRKAEKEIRELKAQLDRIESKLRNR